MACEYLISNQLYYYQLNYSTLFRNSTLNIFTAFITTNPQPIHKILISVFSNALATSNFLRPLRQLLARRLSNKYLTFIRSPLPTQDIDATGRLGRRGGEMAAAPQKVEKSYLASAVSSVQSVSPWGNSRSSTPKPRTASADRRGLKNQQGDDHSIQRLGAISSRRYPSDCPTAQIRWFYATDVNTLDGTHIKPVDLTDILICRFRKEIQTSFHLAAKLPRIINCLQHLKNLRLSPLETLTQ